MSTIELKALIIEKVNSISDDLILEEISRIVHIESEMEQLYVLTMDEETAVEDGLNDVRHGQTYSSADAEIRLKSWLGM